MQAHCVVSVQSQFINKQASPCKSSRLKPFQTIQQLKLPRADKRALASMSKTQNIKHKQSRQNRDTKKKTNKQTKN